MLGLNRTLMPTAALYLKAKADFRSFGMRARFRWLPRIAGGMPCI